MLNLSIGTFVNEKNILTIFPKIAHLILSSNKSKDVIWCTFGSSFVRITIVRSTTNMFEWVGTRYPKSFKLSKHTYHTRLICSMITYKLCRLIKLLS